MMLVLLMSQRKRLL